MTNRVNRNEKRSSLSRRSFLALGGAAAVTGSAPTRAEETPASAKGAKPAIASWRTLGRTGFRVADISMGGSASDANVIRYAFDRGINYLDTAEIYGGGENERMIGEAMRHVDRKKVFITTKLPLEDKDNEQSILERFGKCQERMRVDYVDGLMMQGVGKVEQITNKDFHAAVAKLKTNGRLKHAGIACHGPRDKSHDSMEKVLVSAAEDGRFDLMLLSYNFMNSEEAEKVLAECKKRNVGTTAMKTAPGAIEMPPFDPSNPTGDFLKYIERKEREGQPREQSIKEIQGFIAGQKAEYDKTASFREKHGISSPAELREVAIKWVLQNPDMHTTCVSMRDFEAVDRFVALSGAALARADQRLLDEFQTAYGKMYCRHGCSACLSRCTNRLPVSTIMRYSYYFAGQRREKEAMAKYARLGQRNGSLCLDCNAPCRGACPFDLDIRANLFAAHSLLTIA